MGLLDYMRDVAQGASNAVSSNVSGPVDLLSWGLRKAGLPIPDAPVGGSQWMRNVGLLQDPKSHAAGLAGETLGLLAGPLAAAKAPQIAAGLLQGGANLAAPKTLNPQAGAIVWHGSPHKFDAFDSSKIGTGEGAQVYGHGLYLAESPDVATMYKDRLSGNTKVTGKQYEVFLNGMPLAETNLSPTIKSFLKNHGSADGVIGQINKTISDFESYAKSAATSKQAEDYLSAANSWKPSIEKLNSIRGDITSKPINNGNLYKVDLPDEHIATMLDWDKPLSQQSPEVQKAIAKTKKMLPPNAIDDLGGNLSLMYGKDVTPNEFLNTWESFGQKAGGEAALQRMGIPGIRYLDGGSRGTGQGTSNFVIFPGNEGLLQILERNGQAIK